MGGRGVVVIYLAAGYVPLHLGVWKVGMCMDRHVYVHGQACVCTWASMYVHGQACVLKGRHVCMQLTWWLSPSSAPRSRAQQRPLRPGALSISSKSGEGVPGATAPKEAAFLAALGDSP